MTSSKFDPFPFQTYCFTDIVLGRDSNLFLTLKLSNKPKHVISDGRAGASRSKSPEFQSCSGSYETAFQKSNLFDITLVAEDHEPSIGIEAPNQEPALELHSRAAPSVEAHHRVNGPDTGRNSGGRRIIKKKNFKITFSEISQ